MQKLELTWIGKDKETKLEPRILIEDKEKSYGDTDTQNMLIHGDNLLALKALEQDFNNSVKCIYIDPPYNIDAANPYYNDNIPNSDWLNLMKPRLNILKKLLKKDGILAVQIDDNQFARLYLLMQEIFGENNLKVIVVKMSEATGVKMAHVIKNGIVPKLKEYIILAGKNGVKGLNVERVPKEKWDSEYKTLIKNVSKEEMNLLKDIVENEERSENDIVKADEICSKFKFLNVDEELKKLGIPKKDKDEWLYQNAWRIIRTCSTTGNAKKMADEKRINIVGEAFIIETKQKKAYVMLKNYNEESSQPRIKVLFADEYLTVHPGDFWSDIKTTGLGNEGGIDFTNSKKPEALIYRIIDMCTKEGDYVLDSFLGSGTTAAVAHKMKRNWIGIELENHCYTHCIQRIKSVVDNIDCGGITQKAGWTGGGGFKFYELAPSLLEKDSFGNWVINKEFNPEMLSNAVCKIQGFKYNPDKDTYWKQGYSSENDYIYVTTNYITGEYLDRICEEMSENESLLICCKSFEELCNDRYDNIDIKKIPQAILGQCEFGKDNYNLNIINDVEVGELDE